MINDRRITAEEVIRNIAYLNQLTLEVTNACNLACEYCAYRDLYVNNNPKKDMYMTLDKVRPLFDYLSDLWSKEGIVEHLTYISFYGGEPLLNMPFIKDSVNYFNNTRRFRVSIQ